MPTGTPTNNRVQSTMNPSPRVVAIPVYDPVYYDTGKAERPHRRSEGRQLPGLLHRVDVQGNNVYGRITPISRHR